MANAGLDVFYSPTSGLRSVLTVNTDFAQTEVDQRQVNLTRRLGLSPSGTPQTINDEAKVTGQMGRQDVGFLHVRTGEDNGTIGAECTVACVRRRILSQSSFGGICTRRDPHGDQSSTRQTAGVDVRLATARFRGWQNLDGTGYFPDSTNQASGSDGNSLGFTAGLPNDRWNIQLASRQVDRTFGTANGFVTRRCYRRYQPSVEYGPRRRAASRCRSAPNTTPMSSAFARRRRSTVQPLHRTREQLPVRFGQCRARLAVALPLDSAARQRHLLRLHPQLGR